LRVTPGEVFEVRLQASAVRPLSHLPLTLEYDPAVLAVERVAAGDFLGAAGEAEVLSDATARGRLVIGASRLGQRGGTRGAGTVATITFRAVADGESRVRFAEARALDALLQPLAPFATEAMTVEVGEAPPPRRPDLRDVETEGERPRPRS
jgi:general secretion pathway protein D